MTDGHQSGATMPDSTASSEASDIAEFIADFASSSDDGELVQPDAEPRDRWHRAPEPTGIGLQPEPEPEPATTPPGVSSELIDALGRRRGAASWLAACDSLIALGSPAHPVITEFKRQGGMRVLTGLLHAALADQEHLGDLLDAATAAIASCSGSTARPQQRTFEVSDGVAVRVQELPYEIAGTGHAVWSAAVLQACWLCAHQVELQQAGIKSALELGSGLGLGGLTLAKLGLPGLTVTLSDIVPAIVRNLLTSAALNRTAAGQALAVRACLCDWGAECNHEDEAQSAHGWYGADAGESSSCSTFDSNSGSHSAPSATDEDAVAAAAVQMLPQGETFDLVLAADVLYELDHPALLAGVLKQRLRPGGKFYAVCSIRQPALLEDLLTRLDALCESVVVNAEDTGDLGTSTCPGLGSWTTQHSSIYVGGIQRISATRRHT